MGQLSTYGQLAQMIDHPKAARAVGTAIGHNPIAFLIPCHRVIQSTGAIGGYEWGTVRKQRLLVGRARRLMQLFDIEADPAVNYLPYEGTVHYYGKVLSSLEADHYFEMLMKNIAWENDQAIIFGRKL